MIRISLSVVLMMACLISRGLAVDIPVPAQAALLAAKFQLELAAADDITQFVSSVSKDRENISAASDLIDPHTEGRLYRAAIATSSIVDAHDEENGVTIISYNPVYDLAWIEHFKLGSGGLPKTSSAEAYNLDAIFLVPGSFLRGQASSSEPDWAKTENLNYMTQDFTSVKSKKWRISDFTRLSTDELRKLRLTADEHVGFLMREQIQYADDSEGSHNLKIADKVFACIHTSKLVTDVHKCLLRDGSLGGIDAIYPKNIDPDAYRTLLAFPYLAGTISSGNDEGIIFFSSKVPLENKYVLAFLQKQGRPTLLVLLPWME